MTVCRQAWETWLSGLEDAAAEFERLLAAHDVVHFPNLDEHAPPDAGANPMPPELLPRTTQVLDLLEGLTRRAQQRRDELAGELVGLPGARRRPTAGYSYQIGSTLDIAG